MTPAVRPCGTVAAARRHERAGEPKCDDCAVAWAEHQHAMYVQRQQREKNRAKANRQGRTRKGTA